MTALAFATRSVNYAQPRISSSPSHRVYHLARTQRANSDEISRAIEQWMNETAFMSSIDQMKRLESFRRIIGFGSSALPAIIASLSAKPSLLGVVAAEIAGEDPVTEEIKGDVRAMAGAWIGWYQRARRDFV